MDFGEVSKSEQKKINKFLGIKKPKPKQQSTNEMLGLKSISGMNKKQLGEKLREQLSLGWIFEKGYEKIILVILCGLGVWKIMGWVF